jgi:protein-tyrosine kinase
MKLSEHEILENFDADAPGAAYGRPIGSLLRDAAELSDQQIEQIVAYQRKSGMRFGEAAVALHMVERKDVLEALSQQFQYTPGFAGREGERELVVAADPFSDQAEAFRELRSRLLLEVLGERSRCALAVLSPDAGDGKTYVAANLAVAFSQLGEATLLIDADVRTPRQHRLLGVTPGAGLTGALAGFANPGALVHQVPGLPSLYVMPAGAVPPNPLELLQRPMFGMLVGKMLKKFEHVVLDTPAAIRGADSRVIAARSGAALVIARRNHTSMAALNGLVDSLARGPAMIAGVLMNEH